MYFVILIVCVLEYWVFLCVLYLCSFGGGLGGFLGAVNCYIQTVWYHCQIVQLTAIVLSRKFMSSGIFYLYTVCES